MSPRSRHAHDRAGFVWLCVATPLESNTLQQRRANLEPRKRVTLTALVSAAMEYLYDKTKTADMDLFSDPSHRMSQRPTVAVKSGEGLGFQDFGSSFGAPKAVVTYGKSSKNKFKPAATLPAKPRKAPFHISEDDSDDELLLSSQNSIGGDATLISKRAVMGKKQSILSDEDETVRVNGRVLAAHPDYKPSSSNVLKVLRFKKNKKSTRDGDTVMEVAPPTDSQDLFKPISDDLEILDDSLPGGPSSSRQRNSETSSTHRRSPSAARTAARRFPDANDSFTSKPSSPIAKDTPHSPARPRPRPRVVMKSAPRECESSPESTPRPAAQKRILPLHCKPELPANAEGKRTIRKPSFPSSSRREPQEFPMSLQAKENVSDGAWSGDTPSSKAKKAPISRAATFVHTPKPIPLPSPLGTKRISRGTTFPNLSPLSSLKDKGKARAKSPGEGDVDLTDGSQGERGGPKPFPMSSQMLAGIDRRSKSPSTRSPKRTSSVDSGVEQGRIVKKRKDSLSRCVFLLTSFNSASLFAVPNLFRVLDVDYLEDDSSKPPMFWVILFLVLIRTLA